MIARDVTETLATLADEHEHHTTREIFVRMGVSPEEVEDLVAVMVDRAAQITRRTDHLLDAAATNWLDGFICGVAVSRRRVEHEQDLRDAECGRCGEALMRDGEMLTAFAVPSNGDKGDILCEPCARRVGVWEDG